ncbi:MAG TPA: type II toxin-antitoxin system RelE/ParE family toxin [Fimbriiglobus sp.]|nr:type II toxin-antitoxin system RelE/ParE family toxin [Fimbriiglobus sp.]
MAEVAFHPEARDEYDVALSAYQARSPRASARFEMEVERLLGLIEANPDSFPAYDDEHRFAVLRRFPYSVVYQVQPDRVYVVAVAHSSRDAGYWGGRT